VADRDWNRTTVEVFIAMAMTGSLILAGIGGVIDTRRIPGNGQPWFAWAAIIFGLTVFGACFYFFIHPGIVALDARRVRKLAEANSRRAEVRRQAPVAAAPVAAAGSQVLTIVAATYGVEPHWLEVTEIVRSAATDGRLHLLVNNDAFGGSDPASGVPKVLRVRYLVGGKGASEQDAVFQEGTVARLP
jgi:hypothetical protein